MNAYFKALMTLALILFAGLQVCSRRSYAERRHRTVHHRGADFAEVPAYVSPVTPVWRAPQTDGLSRNAEECSRGGCIDN